MRYVHKLYNKGYKLVSLYNVGPEMENIGQKEMPCEKKKIFLLKVAPENAFKKHGYPL